MFASDESMMVIGMGAMASPPFVIAGLVMLVVMLIVLVVALALICGIIYALILLAIQVRKSQRLKRQRALVPLVGPRPR